MADEGHMWPTRRKCCNMEKLAELKAKLHPGPCRQDQQRHDSGDTGSPLRPQSLNAEGG
jgi:hypothetical protein